jgi:preprotein translocase SecE subunit
MAVAVKNALQPVTQRPLNRLAVGSWLGVAFILGSVAVVFYGLDWLWTELAPAFAGAGLIKPAVQTALRVLVQILALAGLVYAGLRLVGPSPPRGLAAGIAFGIAACLAAGLACLEAVRWLGEGSSASGAVAAALFVVLLGGAVYLYFVPRFEHWLVEVEAQGWFSVAPYKRTQGQRVRRGTILGILVLAGCGIWTLMHHNVVPAGSWQVVLPFAGGLPVTVLPARNYTVPLLLALASFWLAYRVVNYPTFADFLIATEAELNKVSWTTRKRLVQDTVVVLVTVILLTAFLFVVDQLWAFILTKIGVIQIAPPSGGAGGAKVPY